MSSDPASPSYPVGTIAKLLLISERRVQQLSQQGTIPKNQHGRYDLIPAVQGYIRYLQERAMGKGGGGDDYHTEKARLIKLQADKAQIDLDLLNEKVLIADDVKKAWESVLGAFKNRLLAIPTKAAPVVASEAKPGECQKILQDLVEETLAELANYDPEIDPTGTAQGPIEGSD